MGETGALSRHAGQGGQLGQQVVGRAQGVGPIVGEILGHQAAVAVQGADLVFGPGSGPCDAD